MKPDLNKLYEVKIDPKLVSKGTGKSINIVEAVVYDFMPRILGDKFREVETLRKSVHFYGKEHAPVLALDEAYRSLAKQELEEGNLNEALEAYKRGVYYRTAFIRLMARIQDNALFNPTEIQKLDSESDYEPIEDELVHIVVSQDIAFDLSTYVAFLEEVRQLEKNALRLNQLYFFGARDLPYEDMSRKGDPETGRQLRDTYARMFRFSDAAWISREIGDVESQQKYKELARTEPKENPKLEPILDEIMAEKFSDID